MSTRTDGTSALAPDENDNGYIHGSEIPNSASTFVPKVTPSGKSAGNSLSAAEQSAAKSNPEVTPGGKSASDAEENPNGFYKPSAASSMKDAAKVATAATPTGKLKAFAKSKKGPLFFILLLLFGGGALILGSQATAPFAFVNRLIEEFNPQYISNQLAQKRILKSVIKKGKMSDDTKAKYAEQGIEFDKDGKVYLTTEKTVDGKNVKTTQTFDSIDDAFKNTDFTNKQKTVSATWTGQYGGSNDSIAVKVRKRLGFSFNNWANWSNDKTESGTTKAEEFNKTVTGDKEGAISGTDLSADETKDNDGNKTINDDSKTGETEKITKADAESKITKIANAAASGSGLVAGAFCTSFYIATAVSAYSMAQQLSTAFQYSAPYLEAIQKVQAGDGNASPINEVMNSLFAKGSDGKTAMEDPGVQSLFGSTATSSENSLEGVFTSIGATASSYGTCLAAQAGSAAISLLVTFIPGAGFGAKVGTTLLKQVGGAVAGSVATMAIVGIVVDIITKNLDLNINPSGSTLGSALYTGGVHILSSNAQASGSSAVSPEIFTAYNTAEQTILAEQAEYERSTLSPFNTSSRYTFFGSILYNLASAGISYGLSNSFSAASLSAIKALSASVGAIGQTNVVKTIGDCPLLNGIGAVGDMYCNAYYATDTSTLSDSDANSVESIMDKVNALGGFKEYDTSTLTATIQDNSTLDKYLVYCGQRDSQLGLADSAIAASTNPTSNASGVIASLGIPVVSDVADIFDASNQAANSDWITGKNCVASNDNAFWQEHGKYYQRFLEDQRQLANMGAISSSAGQVALNAYYEENPLDTSYIGTLARFSGQTKEQVIATLDELEHYADLTDYNPTYLYPSPAISVTDYEVYDFSSSAPIQSNPGTKAVESIIYADSRSFTTTA